MKVIDGIALVINNARKLSKSFSLDLGWLFRVFNAGKAIY